MDKPQITLIDSKKQQLDPEKILTIDAAVMGDPKRLANFYAATIKEMRMKNTNTVQEGNTMLILHKAEGRVGVFKVLNADVIENLVENMSTLLKLAYDVGYDVIYGEFKKNLYLDAIKLVSKNFPQEQMGFEIKPISGGKAITVKLGPPRSGSIPDVPER